MWAVESVDKIGPLPEGGQVKKGPFFAGDAMYPPQLAATTAKASTGVGAALDELEGRTPLNIAFQLDGTRWTFSDVKNHSDALARGLSEIGTKGELTYNGDSAANGVTVSIAAAKLGLTAKAGPVSVGSVVTAAGTFPIADISTYNFEPVGKAGAAVSKVVGGTAGPTAAALKQVFGTVL